MISIPFQITLVLLLLIHPNFFLFVQAVMSLSWQRSNPIAVKDSKMSAEAALLGNTNEESVIMPDPLPAGTRGRTMLAAPPTKPSTRTSSFTNQEAPTVTGGATVTTRPKSAGGDATPYSSLRTWGNGPISRLQTPRMTSFNSGKDDMEVFSPLVDVQPITPSITGYWDGGGAGDEFNRDMAALGGDSRRTTWGSPTASVVRRFPSIEDVKEESRRTSLGGRQVIYFILFELISVITCHYMSSEIWSAPELLIDPCASIFLADIFSGRIVF
jgi:protein NEDD1